LHERGKKRPASFADAQERAAKIAAQMEILAYSCPANNSTLRKTSRSFLGNSCAKKLANEIFAMAPGASNGKGGAGAPPFPASIQKGSAVLEQ
jgi:hypothetical protein